MLICGNLYGVLKGESLMRYIISGTIFFLASAVIVTAQELKPIQLPAPDTSGGKPIMQALQDRHSTRDFSTDTLSLPVLSDLVWAACGVNRTGEGKRTAPSAMNKQEIDLYLATANGLYLYNPTKHALQHLLPADIREKTGMQDFVKDVPLNIVYVADYDKMSGSSDSEKTPYAYADAAFMAENVYLFCASEGLGTVVRGSIKRPELEKVMNLRANQHIILAQSVGYPKK
jgi:SagB-type dehydrogenase family enzyme